MGSFSRPCLVNPACKIIVHVPIAQLPDTPAPFLNRFDKFRVGIEDALREELAPLEHVAMELASDSLTLKQCFELLWEGVRDFAQAFTSFNMFYGFVPKETVAAVLLRAVQDTKLEGSHMPLIRQTFHAGSAERRPCALIAGDAHVKLREMIRALNFQLLQYARPEQVYMALTRLPQAYVAEYFKQEHFSAVNLIRSLICEHLDQAATAGSRHRGQSGRKFMVFTRTSTDLLHLHINEDAKRSLLPKNRDGSALPDKVLYVLNLASVPSEERCREAIERFHQGAEESYGKSVLLVVGIER